MPNFLRIFLTLLLGAAFTGSAFCATNVASRSSPFRVDRKWESEDGLPGNEVITIVQTHDGYLWLGTLHGLVRFDGLKFEVFDENNTPGLHSSRIVKLFEDSQQNLWIGTENAGIAIFKNGKITNPPELSSGGAWRKLEAACEDASGAVWLYNANGEVWRYANGLFSGLNFSEGRAGFTHTLAVEKDGPIWIGSYFKQCAIGPIPAGANIAALPCAQEIPVTGLNYLLASPQGGYWRLAEGRVQKWKGNQLQRDVAPYPWPPNFRVSAAVEDRQGNLIVGTLGGGIYWLNNEGHTATLTSAEELSNDIILSLLLDREGALWVGTDGGGLSRVKRQAFATLPGTQGRVVQT
ncbi:MAG TPA: two-component regulator propeller domain-containing protein, partial [Verrucomicrobiae bacterium]